MHIVVFHADGRRQQEINLGRDNHLEATNGQRFRLLEWVGGGGNSAVFSALRYVDGRSEGRCAVKIQKQLAPVRVQRFLNEIRILQILRHPKISKLYGAGKFTPENVPLHWAAIELGDRDTWRLVENFRAFPPDEFKEIALGACAAVEHLHENGVLHRDIKPQNFIRCNGEIKMIDFGIAKMRDEDAEARSMSHALLTEQGERVGPALFFSPELLAYWRDKATMVDERSDYFQLGKLLWYWATGVLLAGIPSKKADPFQGALHSLVMAAVQEDPDERPQSISAFREAILAL